MLPVAMPVTGYRSDTANDGRKAEHSHRIDGYILAVEDITTSPDLTAPEPWIL